MIDKPFDELSRRDHGVIAHGDGPALGTSRAGMRAHGRRHGWESPAPGVLLAPGHQHTIEQAIMTAVKAAGGYRVLVGRHAAAWLWGILKAQPDEIALVVPMDRHDPDVDGLILQVGEAAGDADPPTVTVTLWRSRTLKEADAVEIAGIPVTTPARTLIDLAAVVSLNELRSMVIDARQRRIVTLAELEELHRRIRKYPGRPKMRRVLADLDEEDCDSRLEWDFRKEARARGYRPYPEPFPFRCSDGVTIEIDVAFPEVWVAGESDGLSSRADRAQLSTHHKRQNRAVADGWRPFLIDWTRLKFDTDGLFADLDALLASPHPHDGPARMADPAAVDPRFRARRRRR